MHNIWSYLSITYWAQICFASLVSVASAECKLGYDILGLAKQDVGMIANKIQPNSVIGVLDSTFGDVIPPLEKLIQTGKVCAIRTHLRDGTCFRNNKCPIGTPPLNDMKLLGKRASRYEQLHAKTKVPCYVSPVLEHDEKNVKVIEKWVDVIRKNAPSCTPIISAFTGRYLPGILQEKHGNSNIADIVSNDGESLYDADTRTYWNNGKLFSLAWIHRFNLRTTGEKTWTPPLQRKAKATREDFEQINRLMKKTFKEPNDCSSIKSPSIWKSNAEDYNSGDVRENKIVFLTKNKIQQYDLFSLDNRKVGCLKRFDPPFNGLNRYYLGSCSNMTNTQLMDKAGDEWLYAKGGGQCFVGNAIRRLGSYR